MNLTSKPLTIILGSLLIFLQCGIWSGNGLSQIWKLKQSISCIEDQNKELREKNTVLAADVEDLRMGDESIEEHARMDLGMIKSNEIFYQIVE